MRRAGLRPPLASAVAVLAILVVVGSVGAAGTKFYIAPIGGGTAVTTGALSAAPTAPVVNDSCPGTSTSALLTTNSVALKWTDSQSATKTTSGAYLVSGYNVARSTSASLSSPTAISIAGGQPPPLSTTDTNPPNSISPIYVAVLGSGTTDENLHALVEGQTTATSFPLYVPQGTAANTAQITPDGSTGVTVQPASGSVQVVSLSGTVAQITGLLNPQAVAIDPVQIGGFYIAYIVEKSSGNNLVVPLEINETTPSASVLGKPETVGQVGTPTSIVVTPNGAEVFVANSVTSPGTVSAFATYFSTSTAPAVTSVGLYKPGSTNPIPVAMAVSPNSSYLFVIDAANGYIDEISVSTLMVAAELLLSSTAFSTTTYAPNLVVSDPTSSILYVAESNAGKLQEITVSGTGALATSTSVTTPQSQPSALAISPNGCEAFVSVASSTVSQVDELIKGASTFAQKWTTCGTVATTSLGVTADDAYLYVPDANCASTLYMMTLGTSPTVTTITAGTTLQTVVIQPATPLYYAVAASHAAWTSNVSSVAPYTPGFDAGGWQ